MGQLNGLAMTELSGGPLVRFDNTADYRMADNVGSGEANGAETIDTFQLTHCIGEAAHPVAARNVDLPWVSANDHAAILAEAGKKHLHLFARGVLRFIEDDEGIGQCASAHEGDRRNLDLTGS